MPKVHSQIGTGVKLMLNKLKHLKRLGNIKVVFVASEGVVKFSIVKTGKQQPVWVIIRRIV